MEYPAQTPLPDAHIISSSDNSSPKSLIFIVISVAVLGLLLAGGYVAYLVIANNRLQSQVKDSLKNSAPAPTVGIPTPTKIPTPTPTAVPTLIPTPTESATISATPILTPTNQH